MTSTFAWQTVLVLLCCCSAPILGGMTFHHANDLNLESCSTCPTVQYLGYRTPSQVSAMSEADCQNTLIVELSKLTSDSVSKLQQLSIDDLIAYSYGSAALYYYNITSKSQLSSMSLDAQRNKIITELASYYPSALSNITDSQGFDTMQLVNNLLSYTIAETENSANYIDDVQSILGDLVNINQSHIQFGVHDSNGNSMDALHIIEATNRASYYGVYHTYDSNAKQFNIHLSTSSDLIHWTYVRQLLANADMPFLYRLNLGQYKAILMLHEQWMNAQSSFPSRLGFKLYLSETDLMNGDYHSSYNASLTLGCKTELEGTPSVWYAQSNTQHDGVDAYVGFHYNDAATSLDQNAFGILRSFGVEDQSASWTTYDESVYNQQFYQQYHVVGNLGQRAVFVYNDINFVIQEGNIEPRPPTEWSKWRLWIWVDKQAMYQSQYVSTTKLEGDIFLLNMKTPAGSYAFANPAVNIVDCPASSGYSNSYCVVASYFIFSQGAGPGESGSVVFYKKLS